MATIGNQIRIQIFGQSHAPAIGVVIDGLPTGETVDTEELQEFLDRRAPGRDPLSTQRKEADRPEFLSGLVDGRTCGAPVCAVIRNSNARSADYDAFRYIPRPGHADFPARVRFGDSMDLSGGGPFSGRMTAPLCIAGGILMQILSRRGIEIGAHISSIGDVRDLPFDPVRVSRDDFLLAESGDFPVLDKEAGEAMRNVIAAARDAGDSVGGQIECAAIGLPVGLGGAQYDSIEGQIARVVFGIPAVRGISFGNGFDATSLNGSENNDAFAVRDGRVVTETNRHGGVLGGMTTGMPLLFTTAIKPTPSIYQTQQSVDLTTMQETELTIRGRHDPCIVPRAVPCMIAAAAVVIADAYFAAGEQ